MKMIIEPRGKPPVATRAIAAIGAAVAALILVAVPLVLAGANPVDAFGLMLKGAFGAPFAIGETLTRATPMIFTGLAAAIAFRAKLWNIGAEGQLFAGALGAVLVGSTLLNLPWPIALPAVLVAGFVAGAVLMLIPAVLKLRFGADEVVITLLLNFVVILFIQLLVEGPLKDPLALGWPQSIPVTAAADLPTLMPRLRVHWGLIVAIFAAIVLWVIVRRTVLGFEIRAVGENQAAARFAGLPVGGTLIKVAIISGGLAGLAGASEVAGVKGYLSTDLSPGFGYSGIVVAMLAGLSPIGAIFAAIFVAAVFVGADSMSRAIGVSNYIADLTVALALLCVLVSGFFLRFRVRLERATPVPAE
jgi:general nucleoside transport system permease protein